MSPLITAPGAYSGIDTADYHRNPNLLPAPSISASGMKVLPTKSPLPRWLHHPWLVLPTPRERVRWHLERLKESN